MQYFPPQKKVFPNKKLNQDSSHQNLNFCHLTCMKNWECKDFEPSPKADGIVEVVHWGCDIIFFHQHMRYPEHGNGGAVLALQLRHAWNFLRVTARSYQQISDNMRARSHERFFFLFFFLLSFFSGTNLWYNPLFEVTLRADFSTRWPHEANRTIA